MLRNNRDGKIFIDPLTFPHAIRVFMVDIDFTAVLRFYFFACMGPYQITG